jgi:regulator of sigma E protease
METLIRVAQFILSLSILVVLHEFGHYITARMFKTRVEKFYLFFDFLFPLPNVLNFALFKKKIGDTEYGLGWFPMGGYVKIAGMIDESMDEEFLKSEPQPWEFRSKPAYQRLIIMLGGIIVNVLLAIFIYSMLLLANGKQSIPMENAKYGFVCDSLAKSIGLENGDKIVGYDGTTRFTEASTPVLKDMLLNDAKTLQIVRNGQNKDIAIPEWLYGTIIESRGEIEFVRLAFPSDIDSVLPGSVADGKIKGGDKLIQVGDIPIRFFAEISFALKQNREKTVPVQVLRGTDTVTFDITIPKEAKLGITARDFTQYFEVKKTSYNILTCFPAGLMLSVDILRDYVKQFRIIFSPKLKGWKQIGGFGTISKLYLTHWDWTAFWMSTAFLSIVLAFMNLLPIPALDGGHALFTLYEMVTGRKPSDKFLEYAQMVGMVFILGLLILANGNDLLRWLVELFAK